MKKLILVAILWVLLPIHAQAAFTDTGLNDDHSNACVSNFVCLCDAGSISTTFTDSAKDTTACKDSCTGWVSQLSMEHDDSTKFTLSCDNYQGQTITAGSGEISVAYEAPEEPREAIFPRLNVVIPGLGYHIVKDGYFGTPKWDNAEVKETGGTILSNVLGTYIKAIYMYLLVAASFIAVTMLMIAGLQYATAHGASGQVESAKKRIEQAVVGIILLLLAYNIAFVINPGTTSFGYLGVPNVSEIALNQAVQGMEGSTDFPPGIGPYTGLRPEYLARVEKAKAVKGSCTIQDGFSSPTGGLPNQGTHHWNDGGLNLATYDPTQVHELDWGAAFGSPILAPFPGTATYMQSTSATSDCGNRIILKGANGNTITICHVKDFIGADGEFIESRQADRGEVIGHVGGLCCSGQTTSAKYTQCNVPGKICDPRSDEPCDCQKGVEAGNTTAAHVHVTLSAGGSNLLSCLN